jgi:hypothetical protein
MLGVAFYFALIVQLGPGSTSLLSMLRFGAPLSVLITIALLALSSAYSPWSIRSRRDLYPVLLSCSVGTLVTGVAGHHVWHRPEMSPALIAVHLVFAVTFLVATRSAEALFDDLLSRPVAIRLPSPLLAVGDGRDETIAVATSLPNYDGIVFGFPIKAHTDLQPLIARMSVSIVHLLPPCNEYQRSAITSVCSDHGIAVNAVEIYLQSVDAGAPLDGRPVQFVN